MCVCVCLFFFAPLKASIVQQQDLFQNKVAELASSARRISLLEDSVAKHLARQRNLDEQLQVMMGWDCVGGIICKMGWCCWDKM